MKALIDEEELKNLEYKAGLYDDLLKYFNIDCAYLLVSLLQQDFVMRPALYKERTEDFDCPSQGRHIIHPN